MPRPLPACARLVMANKERNKIVSFPRSGISWLFLRTNRFLLHRFGIEDTSPTARFLSHSHLGYLPHNDKTVIHHSMRHKLNYPEGTRVTVLLRDARSILASVYHYRRRNVNGCCEIASEFVASNTGASCLSAFLNDVALLASRAEKNKWDLRFIYYEDMLDPLFLDCIPDILGLGCVLTDIEREALAEDSNFIVHPSRLYERLNDADSNYQKNKYKEAFGEKDVRFIEDHMKRFCKLRQYSVRYC